MKFKDAFDSGLRFQRKSWSLNNWNKKINDHTFMTSDGWLIDLKTTKVNVGYGWFIHPEDKILFKFKKKLDKVLDEE